jgi:hypothetical protein
MSVLLFSGSDGSHLRSEKTSTLTTNGMKRRIISRPYSHPKESALDWLAFGSELDGSAHVSASECEATAGSGSLLLREPFNQVSRSEFFP